MNNMGLTKHSVGVLSNGDVGGEETSVDPQDTDEAVQGANDEHVISSSDGSRSPVDSSPRRSVSSLIHHFEQSSRQTPSPPKGSCEEVLKTELEWCVRVGCQMT